MGSSKTLPTQGPRWRASLVQNFPALVITLPLRTDFKELLVEEYQAWDAQWRCWYQGRENQNTL